jgi:hypothetical protein
VAVGPLAWHVVRGVRGAEGVIDEEGPVRGDGGAMAFTSSMNSIALSVRSTERW